MTQTCVKVWATTVAKDYSSYIAKAGEKMATMCSDANRDVESNQFPILEIIMCTNCDVICRTILTGPSPININLL